MNDVNYSNLLVSEILNGGIDYIEALMSVEKFILNLRKNLISIKMVDDLYKRVFVIINRKQTIKKIENILKKNCLKILRKDFSKKFTNVFWHSIQIFMRLQKGFVFTQKKRNKSINGAYMLEKSLIEPKDFSIIEDLPELNVVDSLALEFLRSSFNFWVNRAYQRVWIDKVLNFLRRNIEKGIPIETLASEFAEILNLNSLVDNLEVLFNNIITTSRVFSSLSAIHECGGKFFEIKNPLDEKTCGVCGHLDGTIVPIELGISEMMLHLTSNIQDPQSVHRWISSDEELKEILGSKITIESLKDNHFLLPPYHGNCRCVCDIYIG